MGAVEECSSVDRVAGDGRIDNIMAHCGEKGYVTGSEDGLLEDAFDGPAVGFLLYFMAMLVMGIALEEREAIRAHLGFLNKKLKEMRWYST